MAATTMGPDRPTGAGLTHAGAGLALGLVQLSAIIPGFLAGVILAVALAAVVVLPLIALGLVAAVVAAPPYALWRLWVRRRSEP